MPKKNTAVEFHKEHSCGHFVNSTCPNPEHEGEAYCDKCQLCAKSTEAGACAKAAAASGE